MSRFRRLDANNSTVAGATAAPHKTAILVACCLSMLIVTMDVTVVNLAIPAIRNALSASEAQMQWVIDVYTLVLASLLLLAGVAGDRYGRRRVFRMGLIGFAVGSLLCSLAPTIGALIAARFVQAIGGSMLNPSALSIISQVFAERAERARALGVWGAVVGASMALGPPLGGVLIETIGWRSVFWVNLPICLVALGMTFLVVPESRSSRNGPLDLPGQILAMTTLFGVVFTLIEGPYRGWTHPAVLASAAATVVALPTFLHRESRLAEPFLDLRFFRSVPFSAATIITVGTMAAWGAFLLIISLYLQGLRHYSALHAGLLLLPTALGALVFSPLSGRMVAAYGSRPSLVTAGALLSGSSVLLMSLTPTTPVPLLLVIFAMFSGGFAMTSAPVVSTSLSGMPPDRAGAAAAVNSTAKQVGVSLGVALCGLLAGGALRVESTFTDSARSLWLATALIGVTVTVLGMVSAQPSDESSSRLP